MSPNTPRSALALVAIAAALLPACAQDTVADAIDDGVLEVAMTDFAYGGLPAAVPAGTRLEVANGSQAELHELVAVLLPDGDSRRVAEIVADGLEAVLAGGPPAAVLLAPPGGEQIAAVGDGTLAVPGRYLLLCAIPTGVDPDVYLAAAAESDGPPQVEGGPPHFVHGMVADLVVTP